MKLRLLCLATLLLAFASCKKGEPQVKAITGATLIDGSGGPPIADSVIVIDGSRIRAAGPRATTPVPSDADVVNASGRYVVPGLIDIVTSELPEVKTLAQVEKRLDAGATAFIGIISDTRDVPATLLDRLRDKQIVFGPRLTKSDGFAKENTKRFADAGIPLAVATTGAMSLELKEMRSTGLTTAQLIVAVTKNGARAIGKTNELGTIEPGKTADLLVLAANPLDDIANLRKFERRMVAGHWQQPRKR